jgi:prephenate dehydrogenase
MAGAEKSGFSAARPDLFHQANVILTPIPQTHPKAIQWAKKFWKSLHTQIHILSPKQHDLLVAQISHFPHLLAACLVSVTPPTSMSLAGPGFRDTTRIAASPPHLWTEILLDNPHATIQAAQSLISDLQKTLNLLNKKDSQNLHKYLSFASKKRSTLPSPPPKPNEINRRQPRPTN